MTQIRLSQWAIIAIQEAVEAKRDVYDKESIEALLHNLSQASAITLTLREPYTEPAKYGRL